MSAIKDRNTVVPDAGDANQVQALYGLLCEIRNDGEDLLLSVAAPSDGTRLVAVPSPIADMFAAMIAALHSGQPITFVPHDTLLTTQEAADFLGVSRPTVVKFINDGRLSCTMSGTHRRVEFADVLALRNERRSAVQDFLARTLAEEDLDSPDEVRAALRTARRSIRERHRKG